MANVPQGVLIYRVFGALLFGAADKLDNVIRRAGFSKTRPQARQGVVHGHFTVNGRKTVSPSYVVRPGDVEAGVAGPHFFHQQTEAFLGAAKEEVAKVHE